MVRLDPRSLLDAVSGAAVLDRRARVLAMHLADAIPSRGRVLDLGCGDGRVASALMRLRPDLRVEGVDVAVRPNARIPVAEYDGRTLPFENGSFDHVAIVDVLSRTADPAAMLIEAIRVARQSIVIKDRLLEGVLAGPTLRLMDWMGGRVSAASSSRAYLTRRDWQGVFYRARLSTISSTGKLGLYPPPLGWLFDRRLHFVALLVPRDVSH